jgi:hypothetical protein
MKTNLKLYVVLFILFLAVPFTLNIFGTNWPSSEKIQEDIHSKVHPNGCGPTCLWIGKPIKPYAGEVRLTYSTDKPLVKTTIFDINPDTGKKFTWLEAIRYNNPLED